MPINLRPPMSSIIQPIVVPCLALFFVGSASLARALELGPEELIQNITSEVMAAVRADKELAAGDREKALELAEAKILPHVDFEEATRLALSRAWSQASAEQKRKLVAEFRATLLRTYTNAMSAYSASQAKYLPPRSKAQGAEATVRYQFLREGSAPLQVAYELRRSGTGWKIYDISVEGISLVLTYRTEFDGIVKQEGIEGLLRRLAQRNAPAKRAL
jgi:phospholipid transport system substrate-binding protein